MYKKSFVCMHIVCTGGSKYVFHETVPVYAPRRCRDEMRESRNQR